MCQNEVNFIITYWSIPLDLNFQDESPAWHFNMHKSNNDIIPAEAFYNSQKFVNCLGIRNVY